jgi:hypothetical protein
VKKHYAWVVFGATVTGISLMETFGGDALCVEETGFAGREYADALFSGQFHASIPGGGFGEELRGRNIITSRGINLPALSPVLFRRISEKELKVIFFTKILSVEKKKDGFFIRVFNADGFDEVTADCVIDTESVSPVTKVKEKPVKKTLNAFVLGENLSCDTEDVKLYPGAYEKDYYLETHLGPEDGFISARKKIHAFWQARPFSLSGALLVSISSTLNIVPPLPLGKSFGTAPAGTDDGLRNFPPGSSYIRLPSSAWADPLMAWEAGKNREFLL